MKSSKRTGPYVFSSKPLHYTLLIALLLFTLYCISSAFNRGTASAWYYNADFSLNSWAKEGKITDRSNYDRTLSAIKKAQLMDPTHPHYAHMVGRIMHWGVDMGFEDKAVLVDIKNWYLLATQLRPLWPDPWVDLLRLNNYLHGYNDETKHYIKQALLVGPYINLVTEGTIEVWLLNWSILTGEEKAQLFNQFDVATKQQNVLSKVLKQAKSINQEKLLCIQLTYNEAYAKQKESGIYRRYCQAS